jgi:hypothetical protein
MYEHHMHCCILSFFWFFSKPGFSLEQTLEDEAKSQELQLYSNWFYSIYHNFDDIFKTTLLIALSSVNC